MYRCSVDFPSWIRWVIANTILQNPAGFNCQQGVGCSGEARTKAFHLESKATISGHHWDALSNKHFQEQGACPTVVGMSEE
jgi:hypothetical protein